MAHWTERRVVVTGLGVVTPLGHTVDALWNSLLKGECGIDKITAFDATGYDTQILDVGPYVPFLSEAWESAGAEVVSTDPFNLTDGDCTNLVLKMKNLKIDYWDFQGLGWLLCASAGQRQQYRPPIGWGGWPTSVAGLATQVGPWIDGIWGGAQGDQPTGAPRQKTAAHDEYVNAIKRYHPEIASFMHYESPATIGTPRLRFTDSIKPSVMTGQDSLEGEPDTSYKYLIMPVRLSG